MNKPATFILAAVLSLFFFNSKAARSVEPMLDADVYQTSRAAAIGLMRDGLFENAVTYEKKALKVTQDVYGSLHPNLAPILNDLGTIYRVQAKYPEAEKQYKWALAIREQSLGPDHPDVSESLCYLASLDVDLGRYTEADLNYQRALGIREKTFEKDSLLVAETLEGQGDLFLLTNRAAEASSALKQCLRIREKAWGPEDLKLVETWEGLARVAEAGGHFDEAETLLKKCLSSRQKALGSDRLEITDSQENLATFYRSRGRQDEAKALYELAAQNRDRFINDRTPEPYLHAAALTELALGRLKDAEVCLNRSLKLRKEVYGPTHPKVAIVLEELADLYQLKGDKSKAVERLKEAKKTWEKLVDPSHPEISRLQKKLEKL